MLTSEELDHLDKSIHCLRLELPKAVADDALPPMHRLVQEHRESLSRRAADDGEAIDREWLVEIGADDAHAPWCWLLRCGEHQLRISYTDDYAWTVRMCIDGTQASFRLTDCTTRGQLRRLLEAIGGKS